jgi:hypothetical protein
MLVLWVQTQQPEEDKPKSKRISKVYNQDIMFKRTYNRFYTSLFCINNMYNIA